MFIYTYESIKEGRILSFLKKRLKYLPIGKSNFADAKFELLPYYLGASPQTPRPVKKKNLLDFRLMVSKNIYNMS